MRSWREPMCEHVRAGEGRLYRETPVALTKAKAPKGRGKAAPEPMEGPWELIGTTMEDMVEIGEKLQRSKKDQDRALATQVAILDFGRMRAACFSP